MALDATKAKKLKAMATNGDHTLWRYDQDSGTTGTGGTSGDALAAVTGSNYFNYASANFKQGDVILFVDVASGGAATADLLVVTSADAAATVVVANGT